MAATDKTSLIKTSLNEYTKCHQEFDGQNRLEYLYTAGTQAKTGEPCMVTRYSYVGSTAYVDYMKEYEGTWDESWEVF